MNEEILVEVLKSVPITIVLLFAWLRSLKRLEALSDSYTGYMQARIAYLESLLARYLQHMEVYHEPKQEDD